jgi:hypothetical protein
LILTGPSVANGVYNYVDENNATISLDGKAVTYTGTAPISAGVTVADLALNYSSAAETITITNGNATQTTVDSTSGQITTFTNPTNSLRINGGADGANTFNLNGISSGFSSDLIINGSGYSNGDVVNLNADPHSKNFTIDNVQTINLGASGSVGITATGNINWITGENILSQNNSSLTTTTGNITLESKGSVLSSAATRGILANSTAITSTDGKITLTGTSKGQGGDANIGVDLVTNTKVQSVNGDISITGVGTDQTAATANYGVAVVNSSLVSSTGTAKVTIQGQGGTKGTDYNRGVGIQASAIVESTGSGNITVTGDGGGTGSYNQGIFVGDNAIVRSTGTGGGAGTVNLNGKGSINSTGEQNDGVRIEGAAKVSTIDGAITITGTATNANSSGVSVYGATIAATGSATVTVTGTSSGTNGSGVSLGYGAQVQSNTGKITITGTGTSYGIDLLTGTAITSNTGDIYLLGETIRIATGDTISTGGNVFINQDDDNTVGVTTLGVTTNITANTLFLNDTLKVNYNKLESQFDTVNLTGALDLNGSNLMIESFAEYIPTVLPFQTLINNDGTDAVIGTFADLAEGAKVASLDGFEIFITYKGDATNPSLANVGQGNDVQLYAVSTNRRPTDFSLLPGKVNEQTSTPQIAGTFTGVDPDTGDILTYSLVTGAGDTDNALFSLSNAANTGTNLPPIAWYRFEDNTNDTTGNHNSTAANGVTYTTGRFGNKAAMFDGNNSYIDIPQSVLNNFSITVWVKTTDVTNDGNSWSDGKGIIDASVAGVSTDFGLSLLGNKAAFGIGDPNNNTDVTIRSRTAINDGNWHHLAVTRDGASGKVSLYVDGIQEATAIGPTGDRTAPPKLRIAGLQTDGNFLTGAIDEVQIYDRTLSSREVGALNQGNNVNTNNTVLTLNAAAPSVETKPAYNVRVKVSDQNGLSFEKPVSILVNDAAPTVQTLNGSDVLQFKGNDNKAQVKITLDTTNMQSNLLNEICAYEVDDADGKINGISKTDSGYMEAALGRSIVIFSTLGNLPSGFKNEDVVRSLQMDYGDQLRFYMVKGNTTQDVLKLKNYTNVVMQPLEVKNSSSDTFSVKFADLSIKVESSTELPPSGTTNTLGQQGFKEGELMYVGAETKATFTINREAAYNNFVGFYKVVDQQGGIDLDNDNVADLKPGDAGYAKAAIDRRVVDLTGQNQVTITGTGNFTANSIFAPFIIVDGNAADFARGTRQAYFTYLGANSDGVDHIRLLGNNVFGFEDLPSGGDRDFNDIIVKVTLKA